MLSALRTILFFITITLLCLPVLIAFAPYIEQGREEARTSHTYHQVRRLKDEYTGEPPTDPIELPQQDPWGTPYVVTATETGQVRVTSAGANEKFETKTGHGDDIYNDMPISPLEPFRVKRNREWLRAFSIAGIVWCLLAAAGWAIRKQLSPT